MIANARPHSFPRHIAERERLVRLATEVGGIILYYRNMKKLQSGDEIIKIDKELGIAWILLPPDANLGGFRGISPRIMDEEKFMAAKKTPEREER
jgi:hypothetical protein